nr:hypothetical protein Iba_chr12cCG15750 [Ipomoea batatas]
MVGSYNRIGLQQTSQDSDPREDPSLGRAWGSAKVADLSRDSRPRPRRSTTWPRAELGRVADLMAKHGA